MIKLEKLSLSISIILLLGFNSCHSMAEKKRRPVIWEPRIDVSGGAPSNIDHKARKIRIMTQDLKSKYDRTRSNPELVDLKFLLASDDDAEYEYKKMDNLIRYIVKNWGSQSEETILKKHKKFELKLIKDILFLSGYVKSLKDKILISGKKRIFL